MSRAHRTSWMVAAAVLVSGCGDHPPDPVAPPDGEGAVLPEIEILSGDNQVGLAGQPLPAPLRIRVTDGRGNASAARSIGFSVRTGGGRAVPVRAMTDGDGIGEARWILGLEDGPQQVSAQTDPGVTAIFVAGITAPSQQDVVVVEGARSGAGVQIDGESWIGPVNDFVYASEGPLVAAGDWRDSGPGRNEVVVFRRRGPPRLLRDVGWTPEPDTLRVAAVEPIDLPVTFWLVAGPFDQTRTAVQERVDEATGIFLNQGVGLRIVPEFQDASAVTDSVALAFTCDGREALQAAVGRLDGRINAYVVPTVDGASFRATVCTIDSDFIALGRATSRPTLAHELGHNFGLHHTEGFQGPFEYNLMSRSAGGTDLTEGQAFRVHFDRASAVNTIYGVHDPSIPRRCGPGDFTEECPFQGLDLLDADPPAASVAPRTSVPAVSADPSEATVPACALEGALPE